MEVLIISLIVGGFIALTVWNVYNFFAVVPEEDRSFLDRPPFGFRIVWPLIQALVYYLGSFLSRDYRINTHNRLRQAGVDFMLSPEQFFAGKLVGAIGFAAFGYVFYALHGPSFLPLVLLLGFLGFFYPEIWLKETVAARNKRILKDLPFYLDVIVLAVESGTNFTGGLTQAVQKAPDGPLRFEFGRVLRDIRAGKSRAEALRELTTRVSSDGVKNVVSSIVQAEKIGSSLGGVLSAQAENLRNTRFLKAEKMAMEAPVKLLGPLVMFIFPNTFLVIAFVILSHAIQQEVITAAPLVWAFSYPG
ncbi:MAG: type II secretion system F family protein [Pseudomonadales bacterium]